MYSTLVAQQEKRKESLPSLDYIRGLVAGEGCFSFHTTPSRKNSSKKKIPVFMLAMSEQDKDLIHLVKESLGLRGNIYEYGARKKKDNYNRQGMVILMIRDFGQLKNIIVPLFYKKLIGYKAIQFDEWILKIGNDPSVPKRYNLIHKLYLSGFYDRNQDFLRKMFPENIRRFHFG